MDEIWAFDPIRGISDTVTPDINFTYEAVFNVCIIGDDNLQMIRNKF